MLNLSEAWREAYSKYLEESMEQFNNEVDSLFEELSSAHKDVQNGFKLVENYFEMYNLYEQINLDEVGSAGAGLYINGSEQKPESSEQIVKSLGDIYLDLMKNDKLKDKSSAQGYTPTATVTVQSVSDMKFPGNIIFFIKQLMSWIVNIVLYFVEKFKNIIRRLLGDHDSVSKIDMEKLKLNLTSAKKLDTISTTMKIGKSNDVVSARKVSDADFMLLEGLTDFIIKKDEPNPKTERVIVTLDLSRDVESLRLMVQHFYDLFDGAYGSFNEKLFDNTDLKLVLDLFADTIKRLKSGDPAREISISGNAYEVEGVNPSRIKENLILTNGNVEKLKNAYVQTAAKIKDISKILNNKQLLMLTDLGVEYKMLTASTLKPMIGILETIPARLKEAAKMEKALEKTKKEYDVLVKKLSDSQRALVSISNITYSTAYSRRMNDLFVAARYMTDIVTLRLSALGLYIKELKDVRDVLVQLNGLNRTRIK